MKEYVYLLTATMKMGKIHVYNDHNNGAKRKRCFIG